MEKRCFEITQCGREENGRRAHTEGVCWVSRLHAATCWMLAGPEAPPERQCWLVRRGRLCTECPVQEEFHHRHHGLIELSPFAAAIDRSYHEWLDSD